MSQLAQVLGANMRRARRRHDLTQSQVAESINMLPEVYGRMERGHMLPRIEMFMAICRALQVTPNELLSYSHTRPELAGGDA
jgi:transcriptional regulator with XRE-family HTH domain